MSCTLRADEATAPVHGIASERPVADEHPLGPLAGEQPRLGAHREQLAGAPHDVALGREVQRNDLDVLVRDVAPDVEFGPVRQREHADALARLHAPVVEVPQFRALALRIPLAVAVAERVDPLLRARALFLAPRAADHRVVVARLQRVEQPLRLQESAALDGARGPTDWRRRRARPRCAARAARRPPPRTRGRGTRTFPETCRRCRCAAAGTGCAPGGTPSARKPQQHRRVLADRVHEHRPLELGRHLAQDVDALGLEPAQHGERIDLGGHVRAGIEFRAMLTGDDCARATRGDRPISQSGPALRGSGPRERGSRAACRNGSTHRTRARPMRPDTFPAAVRRRTRQGESPAVANAGFASAVATSARRTPVATGTWNAFSPSPSTRKASPGTEPSSASATQPCASRPSLPRTSNTRGDGAAFTSSSAHDLRMAGRTPASNGIPVFQSGVRAVAFVAAEPSPRNATSARRGRLRSTTSSITSAGFNAASSARFHVRELTQRLFRK